MNSKKCFVLAVTLLTFLIGLNTTLWGQEQKDPNDKIKVLQERITQLESVVESQQKTISRLELKLDERIKENEKPKAPHKEDGVINDISKKTSFDPNNIVYHGKKRSRLWFDKMYERFNGKIIFVEGKYFDKNTFENSVVETLHDAKTYPKNQIVKLWEHSGDRTIITGGGTELNIRQVLGDGEALVEVKGWISVVRTVTEAPIRETEYKTPIHLTGLEGPLVDGQSISVGCLISLGTYEYITTRGNKSTIPSFKACNFLPLTREQFAEAINSGIDIGEYEVVIKEYGTLGALSENQYNFLENKDDGSVIIKRGDRIIKRLSKGKYRFEIIQKPTSK
jgi:hypothetical protein